VLAAWLELQHGDYLWLCHKATALARDQRFRTLVVEIAQELERVELILRPELERIYAQFAEGNENGPGAPCPPGSFAFAHSLPAAAGTRLGHHHD
jgi:hypothetical protein